MKLQSKRFSISDVLLLALISIQIVLYIFIWSQILVDPSLRTMDFVHFYGAGRLMREGDFAGIYDIDASRRVQREVVGTDDYEPLLFNHPPHLAPLLALIADDDYVVAYKNWSLIRFLVWVVCLELVRRFLLFNHWDARSALLGTLGNGLFFPIFLSFLGGQDTIFSLLGLLVWMFALLKGRDIEAGLGLAFATLAPTIAGALFIPLLVSRRRVGVCFMIGAAILGGYTLVLVGLDGVSKFLFLLKISSEGTYYGFNWASMYNLLGFLLRLFPQLSMDQARLMAWVAVLIVIVLLTFLWRSKTSILPLIGFSMVMVTFASPHLYVHGLGFLMLPLLAATVLLYKRGFRAPALLLTPVISSLLFVTEIVLDALSFYFPYLLMIMLLVSFAVLLHREANIAQ